MRALAIAATGMSAQSTNVDVIANNIANINTTGFKRARAEFTDLLYQTERLQGISNRGNSNPIPEGASTAWNRRTIHKQDAENLLCKVKGIGPAVFKQFAVLEGAVK